MSKWFGLLAVVIVVVSLGIWKAPVARSQASTPIKEMIGVNAVVNNNPSDLAQVTGWVRDYHKWYWYEATKGVYTWSSGWQKLDWFYSTLKAAGVKVMPDVEFAPGWASSNGNIDGIPNPAEHAQYLGDLVRHYGNTIAAVENYNEPNQTWQPVRFPASQFGAMTAQDYDAVKAANPSTTFVLAGMAGTDTAYLDQANAASGGKFDVINFHWYAQGDTTNGGKNPESGGLTSAIDQAKAWRDAKGPGKPIWISEFGWDTFMQPDGRKSKIYAPEASAANYLLRALFIMQGRGVEKGFAYIYRDPSPNPTYLHNIYLSSGLVTDNAETDGRKKPGWYYLATLKSVLGDYSLDRMVSDGPNVYHYEYAIPGTNKKAAVLWAASGERDSGYQVNYRGPAGTLVVPTDGSTTGTVSATDGNLTLSERPVFVLYTSGSAPTATATSTIVSTWTPTTTPSATPTGVPATATEKLVNGGFENGLGGWFIPSWYASTASIDGSAPHGGSKDLRFKGTLNGAYTYQGITAAPGQKFDFTGWINVAQRTGSGQALVELVALTQYNGPLKTIPLSVTSSTTGGWVKIAGTAVTPPQTGKVRLQIRLPNMSGTVYFDDLSLKSTSGPVATAIPTSPPAAATATTPPGTATPTSPPATVTPSTPSPTATPGQPPAGSGSLANTAWPVYGQNVQHNDRSPYTGPQSQPNVKWTLSRTADHWGTDYRQTGVGQNNTLYLAAGMAGVYAIDSPTGQVKWLFSADNTGHETWVEFPPTVAADGTLYVASENDYLYALDPSGKVLWKTLSNHLHTPPSISPDGSTIHFVSEDGFLTALNRANGTLKWRYQLGGAAYGTGRRLPVVYDASGNLYFAWVNTVWSLTPGGTLRWSLQIPNRGKYVVGPAVADDGTMYFVNNDMLVAVTTAGQTKWQQILGQSAFDRTPAIGADGTVYIGAEDGDIYAFNPTGTLKWKQQYLTVTGWGGGVKSNLLLDAKGNLYFLGKDGYVYCVNSQTHQVIWSYNSNQIDLSYPGIQLSLDANGTLYVPVNTGVLLALSTGGAAGPVLQPTSSPTSTPSPAPTQPAPVATATSTPAVTPSLTPAPSGKILWGSWVGSAVNVAGNEANFEQTFGQRAIRHWYYSVAPVSCDPQAFRAWAPTTPAGEILDLSFDAAPCGAVPTLGQIAAGQYDSFIAAWGQALRDYGRPVWLGMWREDNGSWFWWNSGPDWNTATKATFKAAYAHVVSVIRAQGAGNVKFLWSPNVRGHGAGDPTLSYPGAAYVDVLGLDGYPDRGGFGDFYSTFNTDYQWMLNLGKPIIIQETGISLGSDSARAAYVTDVLTNQIPNHFSQLASLVWFSEPGWGNLLDPAYPLTLAAFRQGIGGSYYQGR